MREGGERTHSWLVIVSAITVAMVTSPLHGQGQGQMN